VEPPPPPSGTEPRSTALEKASLSIS